MEKDLIKVGSADMAVRYVGHASLILVSHEHSDHFDPAAIALISKPGTDIILTDFSKPSRASRSVS